MQGSDVDENQGQTITNAPNMVFPSPSVVTEHQCCRKDGGVSVRLADVKALVPTRGSASLVPVPMTGVMTRT